MNVIVLDPIEIKRRQLEVALRNALAASAVGTGVRSVHVAPATKRRGPASEGCIRIDVDGRGWAKRIQELIQSAPLENGRRWLARCVAFPLSHRADDWDSPWRVCADISNGWLTS